MLYICVLSVFSVCSLQSFLQFMLILFTFGFQMLTSLQPYVGYVDGTSHSTQNISSATWVIYAPNGELVSLHGICIGHSTNNINKYSEVIELFPYAISHGIHHLVFKLNS